MKLRTEVEGIGKRTCPAGHDSRLNFQAFVGAWLLNQADALTVLQAMSQAIRRRISAVTLGFVLSALSTKGFADVKTVVHSGASGASWQKSPIVLVIDPSYYTLDSNGVALERSLNVWRTAAAYLPSIEIVSNTADPVGYRGDGTDYSTLRYLPEGDPKANGALATTTVAYNSDTNTILDGDIVINGVNSFTDIGALRGLRSLQDTSSYDLQNMLTHELGHFFGLDDTYEDSKATMYGYVQPGETRKRSLDDSDEVNITALYTSSASSESNSTAHCSAQMARGTPAWGQTYMTILGVVGGLGLLKLRRTKLRLASMVGARQKTHLD